MEHSLDSLRGGHRGIRNSLKHPERREEPEEVGDPILRATAKDDLMFSMAQGSVDHRAAQTKDTALL